MKRATDIGGALSALVVFTPVFALIAALVRREGKGSVLYRGVRAGRFGEPFVMLKFRTMVPRAEELGGTSTSDKDDRLTDIGRLLRRWKLDELPQLVNVLRGEMSLVGPRPQVLAEVATYTPAERVLLQVRPGITDWASIHFRNEGRILMQYDNPDTAYREVIRPGKSWLGLRYVEEASLRTDVGILVGTVLAIFGWSGRGKDIPEDVARRIGLDHGTKQHGVGPCGA